MSAKAEIASAIAAMPPERKRAPFAQVGCTLHKSHKPRPSTSELHHRFPVYLQAQVWPDVDPTRPGTAHVKDRIPVCSDGHNDVHVALNALIAKGPRHAGVGRAEQAEAKRAFDLFEAAKATP